MKYRVDVTNSVNGRQFAGEFDSLEKAQAWVDEQVAKGSWGKEARWECFDKLNLEGELVKGDARSGYTSTRKKQVPTKYELDEEGKHVLDSEGDPIVLESVEFTEYLYPKEYTIDGPREYVNMNNLTQKRDSLLRGSDWLMLSDVPMDSGDRLIFRNYRQFLRDFPNSGATQIESFESYLLRLHEDKFKDGGNAQDMIKMFNSQQGK